MGDKGRRMKEFGKYLRSLREERGVSVRAVATATCLSDPYLYQVEAGKKPVTDPGYFHSLASYFNVPVIQLLEKAGYLSAFYYRTRVIEIKRSEKKMGGKLCVEYRCKVRMEQVGQAMTVDFDTRKTHYGREEIIKFAIGNGASFNEGCYDIDEPGLLQSAIEEAKEKAHKELTGTSLASLT